MNDSYMERALILSQALPYIKSLAGKTIVVKYGGNAMINTELKQAMMSDIVLMKLVGVNVVLVHGGGPEINTMLKKINKEPRFIDGLRYTDKETMEIVQMVLAGKVNKNLVALIQEHMGKAIGICGMDGNLLVADKAKKELGFVGEITKVNTAIIEELNEKGYIPVVSSIAKGPNAQAYNVNADTAASIIASELKAAKLVLMTDIKGLMKSTDQEDSLIHVVNVNDSQYLFDEGIVSGGMIPKVKCCIDAVKKGVARAHIIDGRIPHSILIELFTDEGIGTMFC